MKNNNFQIMRGLCIIAVVITHIIPKSDITAQYDIVIQNVINIAVAGFIFLSGYFVNTLKIADNAKMYLKQRIFRLLCPYILWSIFYICVSLVYGKTYSFLSLVKIFLLGQAAGQLYYLVILFWLTLITPFIVKKMNNKYWNIIFILITPVSFMFLYYYQLNIGPVYFTGALLPTSWFIYYYLGLKWQNYVPKLSFISIIVLLMIGYLLELAESHLILNYSTDIQFASTPLRFLPFVYVIAYIMFFLKNKNKNEYKGLICKGLIYLGNNSYGIYLCHVFFLGYVVGLVRYFEKMQNLTFISNYVWYLTHVVISLLITLFICLTIIKISRKILPEKVLSSIGFS